MDIKKSIYATAVCLMLLGMTGCGGSDELSDEEAEMIDEFIDAYGDGTSTYAEDDFDSEEPFEDF